MKVRLGIDVACRAAHQAACANEAGEFVFSGRRFRTTVEDLERLWASLPGDAEEVLVVMEPTRNAWVPLAAWFAAKGAKIAMVTPEQSSDLRKYYHKHTKNDRLDARILARIPLLHPEGLRLQGEAELGPADPLRRATRRRRKRRTATSQRIDALLEIYGPQWARVLGEGDYAKAALTVLERTGADPRALKRLGHKRLTALLIRASRGAWRDERAATILQAAEVTQALWAAGGLDFAELAEDLSGEARLALQLNEEIKALDSRIGVLYDEADPAQIIASGPGMAAISAAVVLGALGNPDRFDNLAGVRAFTGLTPSLDESGTSSRHGPPTKAGDPALREALFGAADRARKIDPTLAARYQRLVVTEGKHHNSAVCTLAAILVTRLAACWRTRTPYQLRDTDGTAITVEHGRAISIERYTVTDADRAKNRPKRASKRLKEGKGTSRRGQESSDDAPAAGPSSNKATRRKVA
ncbi:IS110 family transposase [Sphaerimonospora mesophila]|uniref:IS110 family transposase n=1 Tax=Sphaerimonospora mesophila TaxID=37483 RepID=UPI000A4A638D